jgi:hypothetical protein
LKSIYSWWKPAPFLFPSAVDIHFSPVGGLSINNGLFVDRRASFEHPEAIHEHVGIFGSCRGAHLHLQVPVSVPVLRVKEHDLWDVLSSPFCRINSLCGCAFHMQFHQTLNTVGLAV